MKCIRLFAFVLTLSSGVGADESVKTPADAFKAGQDFAHTGKAAAEGKINQGTGMKHLPYYDTTAPETAHFQGGRHPIREAGTGKQTQCQTDQASEGFRQQECDAVNFLTKNPSQRHKYPIDKKHDPLMSGSKKIIEQPGPIPGTHRQQCRVETIKTPATFITETCTEAGRIDTLSCDKTLIIKQHPGCAPGQYLGRIIKNICPYCDNPYIVADVYCASTDQGYTMSAWTSKTSDGNSPDSRFFTRRPVPGKVGLSQGNTFIGDFGRGCHFPLYYSQSCDEQTCLMNLILIGSTCNGQDFTAPGSYPIPFTYSETWDDPCGALDSRTR